MKALTLWQPWAWAIAHAGKDVENRTWAPPRWLIGAELAIHAGKKVDPWAIDTLQDPNFSPVDGGIAVPEADEHVRGAVVAIARLVDVLSYGEGALRGHPWYAGPVGWLLGGVVAIDPVPCRGAQGLWDLPAEVEARVREAARRMVAAL